MTVSVFGGPTAAGAAEQGELTVSSWGPRASSPTRTFALTGPDTTDHTTTAPAVPIRVIVDDDVDDGTPGFQWSFTTRDGASYDVASFTLTYTFLTPRS